jgi:hypothetical protein
VYYLLSSERLLLLRPSSDSSVSLAIIPVDPTTHYDKVNESTLDQSDYIYASYAKGAVTDGTDIFGFPDHTIESGAISTVELLSYCLATGWLATNQCFVIPKLRINSTDYSGTTTQITSDNVLTLVSYSWATNPNTGNPWGSDWSIIDNILGGVRLYVTGGDVDYDMSIYCYQLWLEIMYSGGLLLNPDLTGGFKANMLGGIRG